MDLWLKSSKRAESPKVVKSFTGLRCFREVVLIRSLIRRRFHHVHLQNTLCAQASTPRGLSAHGAGEFSRRSIYCSRPLQGWSLNCRWNFSNPNLAIWPTLRRSLLGRRLPEQGSPAIWLGAKSFTGLRSCPSQRSFSSGLSVDAAFLQNTLYTQASMPSSAKLSIAHISQTLPSFHFPPPSESFLLRRATLPP